MSASVRFVRQWRTLAARAGSARVMAASPGRLSTMVYGMCLPLAEVKAVTMSRTLAPWPLPRLQVSCCGSLLVSVSKAAL